MNAQELYTLHQHPFMENTLLTAAERIAQMIEKLGISSYQFGKETGLSHQTISNVLTGKNRPSLDTLEAIATRYPAATNWLLLGREPLPAELSFVKPGAAILGSEAEAIESLSVPAAQLPPAVPSEAKPQREGLPRTPGTATPQEADFVGRLIARLETELADSKAREAQQQQMIQTLLGKSPASPDAAALYATVDRMTVTGFQLPALQQECKVYQLVA